MRGWLERATEFLDPLGRAQSAPSAPQRGDDVVPFCGMVGRPMIGATGVPGWKGRL